MPTKIVMVKQIDLACTLQDVNDIPYARKTSFLLAGYDNILFLMNLMAYHLP